MNDERLDALLATGDPLPIALAGIETDARARADAARIRSVARPRGRRIARGTRRTVIGVAGVGLLLVALVGLLIVAPGGRDPAAPATGIPLVETDLRQYAHAPAFHFLDDGALHRVGWNLVAPSLGNVVGHPVIVSFGDPDCPVCEPTVADVEKLWRERSVGDLAVVAVASRPADAVDWWRGRGATFPVAADPDGAIRRGLGVFQAPATVLIDREGRVAARVNGVVPAEDLDVAVTTLLSEPPPPAPAEPTLIPGPVPASALALGVFDSTPRETPPDFVRRIGATIGAYEESFHAAVRTPSGRTVWVARGPGDVLVMADAGPDQVVAAGGDPVGDVVRKGGLFSSGRTTGGPWYGVGVVLDGYTRAEGGGRGVAIVNNAFVFEGGDPIRIVTISGPAGTRQVRLG